MSNASRVAVLLMAYGTPRTREEIEPYYTDIRRGRPPTPEALARTLDTALALHRSMALDSKLDDDAFAHGMGEFMRRNINYPLNSVRSVS